MQLHVRICFFARMTDLGGGLLALAYPFKVFPLSRANCMDVASVLHDGDQDCSSGASGHVQTEPLPHVGHDSGWKRRKTTHTQR